MKFDTTMSPRPVMKIRDSPSRSGLPAPSVTLAPHAVASFAMIFADAANQGIKAPAKYYSSFGWVHLPGVTPAASDWYYVATNFNLAYSGFNVAVSAIGPGPVPPAI